jgi:hypothetical protein
VGSRVECTKVLGLAGYQVKAIEWEETEAEPAHSQDEGPLSAVAASARPRTTRPGWCRREDGDHSLLQTSAGV